MIICERDHFPRATRYQKCAKFYGEHFVLYKFFCKPGSFRIIGLNVKFSLRSQLEIAAILKVQLTSTFANMAQNAPQDVSFHVTHVTFGRQRKVRVSFHPYAELDYV